MSEVKIYTVVSDELSPPVIGESFCTDMVRHSDYAALEQKLTDMAVQLANSESKCRELAAVVAENAALKTAAKETLAHWAAAEAGKMQMMMDKCMPALRDAYCKTPATDSFLAEVRAQGVEMFAASLKVVGGHEHPYSAVANEFAAQLRKGAAL